MGSDCTHKAASLQQIAHQRTLNRMMIAEEAGFSQEIHKEKKRAIKEMLGVFQLTRETSSPHVAQEHWARMRDIYTKTIARVIERFGVYARAQGQKGIGPERKTKDFFQHLQRVWMSNWGAERIANISDTTMQDIKTALDVSVAENETTRQVIARIRGVSALSAFRSRVIAQTEIHGAAVYAGIETQREDAAQVGNTLEKAWLSVEDPHTRPAHAAMNPEIYIPDRAPFIVGGEPMDHPGDPRASAKNVIHCRCVVLTRSVNSG